MFRNRAVFADKEQLAEAFAAYLIQKIRSKPGGFHLCLSGGSTPGLTFEVLAAEYKQAVPWNEVYWYWGDERCVPPEDAQSNFGMTQEKLLSKLAVDPEKVLRIQGEDTPAEEAKRYAEVLDDKLPKRNFLPSFDLLMLGLGDDGHTASIFPHEMDLWEGDDYCVVATHPDSGQNRISLNGALINNAKEVCFLVAGENKAEVIADLYFKKVGYDEYPSHRVAPSSGQLQWFLDRDAAEYLR